MTINLARFDLTTLRLFVAAVQARSLTAGAERLDPWLAAASKRIAELEGHVGTLLLKRNKRGVLPSTAGRALLPHAVCLVARLEQLALAMGDVKRGSSGQLRLWANSSAFGRTTSLTRQLAAEAEALQTPLRIRALIRGFDAMARMVATGIGLAVLPRDAARPCLQPLGLVLRPVAGMRSGRHLLWVMREREALSPAARALVEMSPRVDQNG